MSRPLSNGRCDNCDKPWALGHVCHFGGEPISRNVHVCPPLSEELRRRIEAEIVSIEAGYGKTYEGDSARCSEVKALNWLLREADTLAAQ